MTDRLTHMAQLGDKVNKKVIGGKETPPTRKKKTIKNEDIFVQLILTTSGMLNTNSREDRPRETLFRVLSSFIFILYLKYIVILLCLFMKRSLAISYELKTLLALKYNHNCVYIYIYIYMWVCVCVFVCVCVCVREKERERERERVCYYNDSYVCGCP